MLDKGFDKQIDHLKNKVDEIEIEIKSIKKTIFETNNKYILFKGKEGFADRLQCLLQSIKYAISTDRVLVVDWRDEDWSHDPNEPIETYFHLVGVRTIDLSKFFSIWKERKNKLTVFPIAWREKIESNKFDEFISNPIFQLPDQAKCLEEICNNKINDFPEDIVVYPGIQHRTFDTNYLQCVKLSTFVEKKIFDLSKEYSLSSNKYDIIHLRGGSKKWMGGNLPDNSLVKDIHNQWDNADEYMDFIWGKYCEKVENQSKLPLYLISDTYHLISLWKEKYRVGKRIPNSVSKKLEGSGIHKLSKKNISLNENISKVDINFECIRDFVLMLNSRILIGDEVSLFSNVASLAKSIDIRLINLE